MNQVENSLRNISYNIRYCVIAILSASILNSFAQEQNGEGIFQEILITGSRSESAVLDTPVRSDVITSHQIDKNFGNDIAEIIRYQPGISVPGSAGDRFGLSGYSIRGIGGDRVKLLVDGVDQADGYSTGPFLDSRRNFFDVESLKAAEIIRGPASVLYGSDALSGVVGFRTKDPEDFFISNANQTHGYLKSEFLDRSDTFSNTVAAANRNENLESLIIYTHRDGKQTSTFSDQGQDVVGSKRAAANPADYDSDNILAKLQYQLNSQNRVGMTLEHFESERSANNLSEIGVSSFTGIETTSNLSDDKNKRDRISVEFENTSSTAFADRSVLHIGYQDSKTRQQTDNDRLIGERKSLQNRFRFSRYEESAYNLDLQFDKQLQLDSTQHFITYGIDLKNTDTKNQRQSIDSSVIPRFTSQSTVRDYPKSESEEYSLYLQDSIKFADNGLTLIPGLRYDYSQISPSVDEFFLAGNPPNKDPQPVDDDKISLKLGAIYSFDDSWSVFAQFAEGFKTPKSDQIYGEVQIPALGYQVIGNPDLKPETSEAIDLGLRFTNSLASFELGGFYTRFDNFIEQVLFVNDQGIRTFQFLNRDKVKIKGIELKGEVYLDQISDSLDGYTLHFAAAYNSGDVTSDVNKEMPLDSIEPASFVAGLEYSAADHRWGWDFILTAAKNKSRLSDDELFSTPGFVIADFTMSYKIHEKLSLNGGVFNITDKKYWRWNDVNGLESSAPELNRFTQPGRNFTVNLKWEF